MELTKENVKAGLVIVNKYYPEWGMFVLQEQDLSYLWVIRGDRGTRVLYDDEFKFWKIAE